MLSLVQRTSSPSTVARSCRRVHLSLAARRSIQATTVRWSSTAPEPPTPEEEAELAAARMEPSVEDTAASEKKEAEEASDKRSPSMTYKQFLNKTGAKFRYATPKNWLGGNVPFPMNPSFKPPPPLSDAVRQEIYSAFMKDPEKNSVRSLSQTYHLSLKRVDAILRLKGLEHSWYKNKPIQYGFQEGMDKLLGAKSYREYKRDNKSRWDTAEADSLEEDENRDAQRQRYQRHYWESVPEDGTEPIVPAALEHAKNSAQKLVKFEERQKSTHPRLMPKFPDSKYIGTPPKSQTVEKTGRPVLEIRDVGGRFLNLNDSLKRLGVAERRAREKEKKREKQKATIVRAQS